MESVLFKCPECGEFISTSLADCPHCGYGPDKIQSTAAENDNDDIETVEYIQKRRRCKKCGKFVKKNQNHCDCERINLTREIELKNPDNIIKLDANRNAAPETSGIQNMEATRRGGKREAAGFIMILIGFLFMFSSPIYGGLLMAIGFMVFLVGRFM